MCKINQIIVTGYTSLVTSHNWGIVFHDCIVWRGSAQSGFV